MRYLSSAHAAATPPSLVDTSALFTSLTPPVRRVERYTAEACALTDLGYSPPSARYLMATRAGSAILRTREPRGAA